MQAWTHTHRVIHSVVWPNCVGWLRKTDFAIIALFKKKKKKAQGDSRWCFLLMLFALVNHAFLPIYHISIFQSFSEGSPSPWSLFWLLCWKLCLCFLNISSATVQTAETCSSGTLSLEWQTLHITIPRFSTMLWHACTHEMRPHSCVICPGGAAFFKSANVVCFLENHLQLGKNSRYMIS